jgi:hypothetical protein
MEPELQTTMMATAEVDQDRPVDDERIRLSQIQQELTTVAEKMAALEQRKLDLLTERTEIQVRSWKDDAASASVRSFASGEEFASVKLQKDMVILDVKDELAVAKGHIVGGKFAAGIRLFLEDQELEDAQVVSTCVSAKQATEGLKALTVEVPAGTRLRWPAGSPDMFMTVVSADEAGAKKGQSQSHRSCPNCGGSCVNEYLSYYDCYAFCPNCSIKISWDGGGP